MVLFMYPGCNRNVFLAALFCSEKDNLFLVCKEEGMVSM